MTQIPLCSIIISSQLPPDDIEFLESELSLSAINIQKSPRRVVGVDDIVLVATVISGLAATAQLVDYGIKTARAINSWRRQLRQKGIEPQGKLEHPKRPPLDLNTATDEEIEEWLSQK